MTIDERELDELERAFGSDNWAYSDARVLRLIAAHRARVAELEAELEAERGPTHTCSRCPSKTHKAFMLCLSCQWEEARKLGGERNEARAKLGKIQRDIDEATQAVKAQMRAILAERDAAERLALALDRARPSSPDDDVDMPDGWRDRLDGYRRRHGR